MSNVIKRQGNEKPEAIRYQISLGLRKYTIAFDVKEVAQESDNEEANNATSYEWCEATFPVGVPTYANLVAAFVHGRYTDDDMQALVNNHLLDEGDELQEAEWNAMQEWRKECKQLAKNILERLEGH